VEKTRSRSMAIIGRMICSIAFLPEDGYLRDLRGASLCPNFKEIAHEKAHAG
jgi:hypothetical protein